MRRLAALLVLTLALATPAGAQQGRIAEVPPQPELRGSVEADTPVPIPAPIALAAPPAFSAFATRPADAGRCRMSCAQDYYFCLAQDEATDCGPGWRQCLLACGPSATPAAPGV